MAETWVTPSDALAQELFDGVEDRRNGAFLFMLCPEQAKESRARAGVMSPSYRLRTHIWLSAARGGQLERTVSVLHVPSVPPPSPLPPHPYRH